MRKVLFFLVIALFTVSIANAQFKVMLVDDDDYQADESSTIVDALTNWGGVYTFKDIQVDGVPTYAEMSGFDMVIWYTSTDGVDLNLWDVSDTTGVGPSAIKFNSDLTQYVNNGGVLWIDGLDYLYDIYGGAPDDFVAGDFVYDVLGIDNYVGQSHQDDGTFSDGVQQMDISAGNSLTTLTPIKWKWATLYNADALEITADANALYEMGPAGYDFEGKVSALYKGNIITSGLRIAALGDGTALDQTKIDQIVSEMISAAQAGNFASVNNISKQSLSIYPNPVTETATINLSEINTASELMIFDNMGRKVYSQALNANQENVTINVSDLASGLYHINITSNNSIYSTKFSVVK